MLGGAIHTLRGGRESPVLGDNRKTDFPEHIEAVAHRNLQQFRQNA